jgi:hypothetical protein
MGICERLFLLPTHVFWPSFLYTWSGCDCTWPVKSVLLDMLRYHHRRQRSRAYLLTTAARFFDDLPDIVQVWRGCASFRVRGLSWTTDESVARRFASGMRFDSEVDRVLARGLIPKEHVFAVFTDRDESEIVLDPRRLRQLSATPVEPGW